jgi:Two component regulator propeller
VNENAASLKYETRNTKYEIKRNKSFHLLFSLFTFHFLFFFNLSSSAQVPIGNWREHLNYQAAIQVALGDKMYCATSNNIFSVDANNEIDRYSKVNGLNDVGVNCIAWDDATQQLVIAYANSNVDILKGSIVKNIGDIKRSNTTNNKIIYNAYCKNGFAYLCSGLGVIVADLNKYEIKDTWIIGSTGNAVKINGFTTDGTYYYAASDEGLKRAAVNTNNLNNYSNWQNISGSNGLSNGAINNVLYANQKLIIHKNDSLFVLNGTVWSLLYADVNWPIVNVATSDNKLMVCQRTASGNARVIQLNTNGIVEKNITQSGVISFPKNALTTNNVVWVADYFGGLASFNGSSTQRYIPNGPLGTASGDLIFNNDVLYAAAGSVNNAWNYQYNRNGIYNYSNSYWDYVGYYNKPILDSVLDFIALAVNPVDNTLWAGSYGGGLVNFNTTTKIYKQYNSSLQTALGDPTSCRVSGLAFDQNNNLWVANYAAPKNLSVLQPNGKWTALSLPVTTIENAISQIVVDDADQLWIVAPRGNGLYCYNYGKYADATNDDQWKLYQTGIGKGNLPSNNVYCLAKDKNSFIWVGTDNGIAVVQCAVDAINQSCDAVLPVVQEGAFAGYLFHGEQVQTIAVDGANRKWVGTKNGVWLISAEGDKTIEHFTVDNSPLLDNDVNRIAINTNTGEVFFSTFKGICSYMGTSTEGTTSNSNVLVFPNPVPPNYNGTIAVRGVVNNALVKIAEPNGRLVFQTRALGGQAVWDGKNYKGEKAASGVYLVLITDDTNTEKLVTKIVIVSGR